MEVCVAAGEKLHPHLPQKVLKKIMAKATVIIHSVRRARFGNVLTLLGLMNWIRYRCTSPQGMCWVREEKELSKFDFKKNTKGSGRFYFTKKKP